MKIPAAALFLITLLAGYSLPADQPPVPDFFAGDKLPEKAGHDWNLGPTGARGWFYAWRGASTESRQILVTEVASNSPSDGVLKPGDVLLGIGGAEFDSDARIAIAKAITAAESADGKLQLVRWREGQRSDITIQLESLGSYGATAPWDCHKSATIFQRGCENLAKRMTEQIESGVNRRHPIQHMLNALALLSSPQREKFMPVIKHEVQWARQWKIHSGYTGWDSGWVLLLLSEYYILTGDESVRPDLERIAKLVANGSSNVGTWGHRFAYEHNGILRGYGAMNQVGLSLTTGLVIARDAGISNAAVDDTIEKSARFLRFYVGKGGIPYGDHHPWLKMHDDNGKASAGAVLFDVLGDAEAAQFYSRLGLASYGVERETGHTGNFFNMLWALPGISRSGPEATGAWIQESAWQLDMARRHDFSFDYLGIPGDRNPYHGWDCTGAWLLAFSLNHASLRFTGSGGTDVPQLSKDEAAQIIEDGRGYSPRSRGDSNEYDARSTVELLHDLTSWSPVVRNRAALSLAKRDEDIVPQLIELAQGNNGNARQGACAALEQLGERAAPAVPVLTALLDADDLWLRVKAAEALAAIGASARPAIPALLRLAAQPPDQSDPRGHLQRYVAFALFDQRSGLLGKSIADVDRQLLREAIAAVLKNEDGRARGSLKTVYSKLTYDEIRPILPAVLDAIIHQSPSGVMFSDGIRQAGLEVLAKHRIAEGIPLCVLLIERDRWHGNERLSTYLKILNSYGAEAQTEIPMLEQLAREIASDPDFKRQRQRFEAQIALVQETIKKLRNAKSGGELRTLD